MTNPGDSDEWWKQYGGEGVSSESGGHASAPPPPAPPQPSSGQTSAPHYQAQPMTPPPQQQYPSYPQPPGAPYGQPGYGGYPPAPGYQPYGYPQAQGTNGMAIGALIAALVGFFTCGVGFVVGLILGPIALNQIKQTGQEGRGLALAGIWISGIALVLSVLWFVFVIAFSGTS
ncbi:DUF4190 domain-containing protein [Nocardia sp. CDC159]|uniref:DUF4190 domain-containing protein n=1 Tax=Nocardia pulmonis TaxID=2951408 RepID=A0A9X2J1X1_9NOCA|nr:MULTISPECIES: DUF4190 domain-containing protein [Nocardia]MCM6778540.1 DUF4190 domain-containing protein [Nocardia pulmonis]MCM6791429.1 DUF4190 domain-containing protein [Nocardia sp. CDC159]